MTHKLILKVKKSQFSGAKRFGTVEEKPPGGAFHTPPYYLGLKGACMYVLLSSSPFELILNQI